MRRHRQCGQPHSGAARPARLRRSPGGGGFSSGPGISSRRRMDRGDARRIRCAGTMSSPAIRTRRRWLAPEVVQTSNADCGPASLKCLLEGYGVHASYGRLREACQTDVDGTSIDALEEIAAKLGLGAEQVMLPLDYFL